MRKHLQYSGDIIELSAEISVSVQSLGQECVHSIEEKTRNIQYDSRSNELNEILRL